MRWLAAAWTLASTADNFVLFVLLWIAEPQGWSGGRTALLILAIRAPTLLSGTVGGWAIDRFGPVPLLLGDGMARAALMAGLVVAGRTGQFDVWLVLVLCAAAGATAPWSFAAARTLVPRLVDGDDLGRANALLGIGDQLPMVLGALLAGPALALLGPGYAFAAPLVLMIGVAVIATRLPRGTVRSVAVRPAPRRAIPGAVVGLVGLSVAYHFTYGPFESVLPHFVRENLDGTVGGYSLLWVLFGLASLATLPAAARLGRNRPGTVNALGALGWGIVTVPLVLTTSLPQAAIVFVVSGAVWGPYSAVEATAVQRWTDPAMHGRVFGLQRAFLAIASPAGAAVGVLAVDHAGPAAILAVSALACSAAGLVAVRPLYRADRRQPVRVA